MAKKKNKTTRKKNDECKPSKRKSPKLTNVQRATRSKRIKEINRLADKIQERSGGSVKTIKQKVYKKSRKRALIEAGKQYKKANKKYK